MVKNTHILFIVENNSAPGDVRVWNEALAAREFGYDVSVICPKAKKHLCHMRKWMGYRFTGTINRLKRTENSLF